ncbi:hypothetical protein FUAX_28160 [Fulvitalea axinellae]|uniref:Sensory/regulatory protein RpfC n=2 Tax=Fulvitalea axinellae TaxID=1182444 RepID=A0AAU9D778_9BACT|nr:hypothetical protein FUAX_28160 [Fulvitalea axinellae]
MKYPESVIRQELVEENSEIRKMLGRELLSESHREGGGPCVVLDESGLPLAYSQSSVEIFGEHRLGSDSFFAELLTDRPENARSWRESRRIERSDSGFMRVDMLVVSHKLAGEALFVVKVRSFSESGKGDDDKSTGLFRAFGAGKEFHSVSTLWTSEYGLEKGEGTLSKWFGLIHPDDFEEVKRGVGKVAARMENASLTYRIKNLRGEYRWLEETIKIPRDTEGELLCFAEDVTDLKELEEKRNFHQSEIRAAKKIETSLDNARFWALSIDNQGRVNYANQAFLTGVGYEFDEIDDQDLFDLFLPFAVRQKTREEFDALVSHGEDIERDRVTVLVLTKSGGARACHFNLILYFDESGKVSGITLLGEDITEERRKEKEPNRNFEDRAEDFTVVLRKDLTFKFIQNDWASKLGLDTENSRSQSFVDLLAPFSRQHFMDSLERLDAKRKPVRLEVTLLTKGGKEISLLGSLKGDFRNGNLYEISASFHDISNRLKAESALKLYYYIARIVSDSNDTVTLFKNIHEELRKILPAQRLYVRLDDELFGGETSHFCSDSDNPCEAESAERRHYSFELLENVIERNSSKLLYENDIKEFSQEYDLQAEGEFPASWLGVPLRLKNRVIGAIAVVNFDKKEVFSIRDLDLLKFISGQLAVAVDKKYKEDAFKAQAARQRAIFDSGTHHIWSIDQEWRFTSFNKAFETDISEYMAKGLGAAGHVLISESLPGGTYVEPKQSAKFWREKYGRVFETGGPVDFEIMIQNRIENTECWRKVFLNPIFLPGDKSVNEISGFAYDITEGKKTELELIQSELKFRDIFESFQDLYFRCLPNGKLTMLSPSVKEVTGLNSEQILNNKKNNINDYYKYTPKTKQLFKRLLKSQSVRDFEASLIKENGDLLRCICNVRLIRRGKHVEIEGVARDITPIVEANKQLKAAKDVAENSLKVKESFLANMSHEIRTPMNGIIGMIDLIADTKLDEEQKGYVKTIKKSSETLLNILNDILDLSKIEAGKMQLYKTPVRLTDLMEKFVSLYHHQAKEKGVRLGFMLEEGLPAVLSLDETRMLQVLSNLTSNAIKFTEAGGSIDINLRKEEDLVRPGQIRVYAEVVDTGIGISKENLEKIFSSFTQADISTSKSFGGVGLGLAISKELCGLMGGRIGVASEEGQGSTFWFTVTTEECLPEVGSELNKPKNDSVDISNYLEGKAPKIMLVDDNMINRTVSGEILRKAGCRVELVDSGQKAIEMALEHEFDVIFMDIQMPGMDGIEATQKLRNLCPEQLPPIIAMTAYAMREDRDRFLSEGFDDYVPKPVRAKDLLDKVNHIVGQQVEAVEPEVEESEAEPIINTAVTDQLRKYADSSIINDVYGDFDIEAAELINGCKLSLETEGREIILSNLHTLKGNAGTLGIDRVTRWARDIEANLKAGNDTNLKCDLDHLWDAYLEFKKNYLRIINP